MDVAREAGVSPATVSRVLSGTKPVSAELERRVRDVVDTLGYRPSPAAQGLLRGTSHTVGVVAPDLGNPYFAEILKGVTGAAEGADFRTLVTDTDERPDREYEAVMELARWADGVILCAPRMPEKQLAALADRVGRLVCVNRRDAEHAIPSVTVDFHAGMGAICAHLRDLGHRHVAYLRGPEGAWSEHERRRALVEAGGLKVTQVTCGPDIDDGRRAAAEAMATGASAIVAFSDYVALGVLSWLREHGIRVPGGVSLTGFDDTVLAAMLSPALTTTTIDTQGLGRRAWELMFADGEETADVTVTPELVVRASTAPPAQAR
jgi:LacI family transcriptional regulator